MYPMNESPPRSPGRRLSDSQPIQPAVIQKQTTYTVTEQIRIITPNNQPVQQLSIKDRIQQTAQNSLENVREQLHLPGSLSKEMRRWLPVISSVLLAILLVSLKHHFAPSDSALSRTRLSGASSKFGWDRAAVHQKVHDAFDDARTHVKDKVHSLEDHYHHFPDQNWLKSESGHHLTAEERAAQLIEDLHEQARRLHIQDPTEVHYEPLTEAEQARLHHSARGSGKSKAAKQSVKDNIRVPLRPDSRDISEAEDHIRTPVRQDYRDLSEAVDVPYADARDIKRDLHSQDAEEFERNATEYHTAKRLVHLSHDLRTRAESAPNRLMRHLDGAREQFVDGMQQLHDLITRHRTAPEHEKESGPSYHEKAQHILRELEDISHRITDIERLHKPAVKKTSWYAKPTEWFSDIHPTEWVQDQYYWIAGKTFGLSEEARHRAAQVEEEVRHEAARLQELMKHELRLLKLEANRVPGQMKKASKNMKSMPMDMLEHFA